MITIPAMHDAICNFLQEKIAGKFTLRTKGKNAKEIKVRKPVVFRSGWILPKKTGGVEGREYAYPYIAPRIFKAENVKSEREAIATLDVFFGVYAPGTEDEESNLILDGSGYRDFWNLIESTRMAFFSNPVIADRFRIVEDFFEAEMIEEQIYPYYEGHCRTKWDIVYPRPQLEEHLF